MKQRMESSSAVAASRHFLSNKELITFFPLYFSLLNS